MYANKTKKVSTSTMWASNVIMLVQSTATESASDIKSLK